MLKMFSKIKSLRLKLLIQFGILIALSSILMGVTIYTFKKMSEYNEVKTITHDLSTTLLQIRKCEKDFLLQDLTNEVFFQTGKSKFITKFDEHSKTAIEQLQVLENSNAIQKINFVDSIQLAEKYLQEYAAIFHKMTDAYRVKGYKDWGHEGELRASIHSIEEGNFAYDKVLLLTLRRFEKDFLLRKDLKNVEKFDNTIVEFKKMAEGNIPLTQAIDQYSKEFHHVVASEVALGLTLEDGIKKELRTVIHKIEPLLASVKEKITIQEASVSTNAYWVLTILFFTQLALGIALAFTFANILTFSIHAIQDRISKLSDGLFPDRIIPTTEDELGITSLALNNLVDRVRTAANFAGKIGEGELNIAYDEHFNNDVLAKSLQAMHLKLKETAEESRKRNWVTVGLANFGEIVRKSNTNLKDLSQELINNLVKYLGANQGQLYVVRDKSAVMEEHLELMATYAWNKVKYETKTILKGDGLAGQTWVEQQTIYLTQIPKDYVAITSGLGESLPNAILIVPLKVNEEVFGVVEIASFQNFEQYQIDFVEKLAEVIASSLSSAQINARTKSLLEQSQQQTEEMRAQEEEMRQNMEEMQATQEEMERKELEMANQTAQFTAYIQGVNNSMLTIEFDAEGFILTANQNFLKATGYALAEIQGSHHKMFVKPDYANSSEYRSFWPDLAKGIAKEGEFERIGKSGTAIKLKATYTPIINIASGKVEKVVKFAMDITPNS